MKPFSKQFTAWVTSLRSNIFEKARIRLTVIYALTMALVMIVFSVLLFVIASNNIRGRLHGAPRPAVGIIERGAIPVPIIFTPRLSPELENALHKEITDDIKSSIILLDSVLFVLITIIGYILAGKTLKPIEDAHKKQKRFIADASHDLRTPLAIMQSEIEVMLRDQKHTESEYHKVLKSSLEEVQTMSQLVGDLLVLSRFDGEHIDTTSEHIDLGLLVHNLLDKFRPQASVKKLDIHEHITSGFVYGSQSLITRAISNVLENAIAYTETGSITIETSMHRDMYHIRVVDTGLGIDAKDLPHVFDRFYRGDNARTKTHHSGLGLAIVKEIVTLHKGTVSLVSTPGTGTTISIKLPIGEN